MVTALAGWLLLGSDPSGGLGLGEPWDSLVKAAGALLVLVLAALWREWLFLPRAVKDRDARIEELIAQNKVDKEECDRLVKEANARTEIERAQTKETFQWLRDEAIPLVSKNLDLIERISEKLPQTRRAAQR